MDANSEKVMEKSVEKSVAATGGGTEEQKSVAAATEPEVAATTGAQKAPKKDVTKEESSKEEQNSVSATTEPCLRAEEAPKKEATKEESSTTEPSLAQEPQTSLAATTGGSKKATEKPLGTNLENTNSGNKAQKTKTDVVVEPTAATSKKMTTEKPLGTNVQNTNSGNKAQKTKTDVVVEPTAATSKKMTTEKPLGTNLENTNSGNKAQKTKTDVVVKPIAGTSKNLLSFSAQTKEKEGQFTNLKRRRTHFGNIFVPKIAYSNKKLKTSEKEEALDCMQLKYVETYIQQIVDKMPKTDVDPQFIEKARREIEAMPRRALDDLVIETMTKVKDAKDEFLWIRKRLLDSENTLATYRRKIAELSQQFHEMDTTRFKTSFSCGQNLPVAVNSESIAAGSKWPASKETNDAAHDSKQVERSNLAKTEKKAAISSTNKIAPPKANPANASPQPGQPANKTLNKTPQKK